MINRYIRRFVSVLGISLLSPILLFAQEARPDSTAMQALVSEIRELRLALERSNLLTLRFQAALQANQLHADRLKELSQQLTLVTVQLSAATGQRSGMSEEVKVDERNLLSTDPAIRKAAEERLPHLKAELEAMAGKESDLRSRESELRSEIQRETTQMEDWKRWLQQFEQYLQTVK